MDNCWDYHDGVAEERMGKALAVGGRRCQIIFDDQVLWTNGQRCPVES